MVFYVGTAVRRTWRISDLASNSDLDITGSLEIYWGFSFANKDLKKVLGTKDTTNETVTFLTPDSLFSASRKGPSRHSLYIKEASGIKDLTKPIIEWVEDGIATPAELDAVT